MSAQIKSRQEMLSKLGVQELNAMQQEAIAAISSNSNVILLSPTGTGKTLAFLLPMLSELDPAVDEVQALILAPSRELAIQIEQVLREMGTGFKINALYGGRSGYRDRADISHRPAILIGTPGRIADHIHRRNFSVDLIKMLVLDEYDKSLEIGFQEEIKDIMNFLPKVKRKVLTSATKLDKLPGFMRISDPVVLDHLTGATAKGLQVKVVSNPKQNKLELLSSTIAHIGDRQGIIFCNLKDSIQLVSDFLHKKKIMHGTFYGGMEQYDRERTLIKLRNGTINILLATDLAARGIDIPDMDFIIHFELPLKEHEFVHRNGRTARMKKKGTAYVLKTQSEKLPEYMQPAPTLNLESKTRTNQPSFTTLFISGGRQDKISKGDIAGLLIKEGKLDREDVGVIELKQDCAFVAVKTSKATELIAKLSPVRLKKKKVTIRTV